MSWSSHTTQTLSIRVEQMPRRKTLGGSSVDEMLTADQLIAFAQDGYVVVPDVIGEEVLLGLDAEVDRLVSRDPPPPGKVGFHHYFEHPSELPIANQAFYEGGVRALAEQLVAPLSIDLAFDHIQVATSICGWDHEPGGGHIDGYGIAGQIEPHTFTMLVGIYLGDETESGRGNLWVWPGSHLGHERLFRDRGVNALMGDESRGGHACLLDPAPDLGVGRPVLARRGDVLLAHYLLAHNQSGNTSSPMRKIVYFRLAAVGHRRRWAATQTDAFLEYAPIRSLRSSIG